jgi:hypothetical protein
LRTTFALTIFAVAACGGGDSVIPLPDAPSLPDARPLVDAPFLGCTPPTGAGTTHGGSVSAAETWTAADSPHMLPFDTSVYAALTIEACAIVQIGPGRTVTIPAGGSITATGTSARPVTFERLVAGTAWSSIRALGGDLSLTHAIVTGGGDPLNTNVAYAGAIHMQRDADTGSLHVDDVDIADSLSQGVYINGLVGFDATSQNLRVHGSVGFPVHTYPNVIGSVPTGTYTGNGRDEIGISGTGGPLKDSQTLHDRGVPYHVGSGQDGGRMDVRATTGVAVLTIEPGVTIRFPPGGTLNIDILSGTTPAAGALIAIGTEAKKIVFTSDQVLPAAGDWLGIGFSYAVNSASALSHVQVKYAGGAGTGSNSCPYPGRIGQNDAAIRIFGTAGPLTQFITDTEIIASGRDGIDRGWRDDITTDFLGNNNSFDVGPDGCKQSTPRTFNGVCPPNPPCP